MKKQFCAEEEPLSLHIHVNKESNNTQLVTSTVFTYVRLYSHYHILIPNLPKSFSCFFFSMQKINNLSRMILPYEPVLSLGFILFHACLCQVQFLPSCLLKLSSGAARVLKRCLIVCFSKPASSEKLTAARQNKSQMQSTSLTAHRKTQVLALLFLGSPWTVVSKLSSYQCKNQF